MAGYPHKSNMLVAIPVTGRPIPPQVMFAFHSMAYPMNWNHYALQLWGLEVGDARCQFADSAEANGCKYIFFWDEDVACPPQAVPELVYKMEHNPKIAVCGGVYCLKREPAEPLLFRGNGNGPFWDWKAGEFFQVTGIGMGCTVVRVDALKDLKKPYFRTVYDYSRAMDGVAGIESWTEDLWFCQRIMDTGKWDIYADASIICTHYDPVTCKAYNLPPDSKPVQHLQYAVGKSKILDIGSGRTPYKTPDGTCITADPDERSKPDYRCDLRKLPFANKEFDIVFSPALDRFPVDETEEVLAEWVRVMKDTGEIRIVVSNFEWAAQEVVAKRISPSELLSHGYRTGFTIESLEAALLRHGLKTERIKSDPAHIAVRGKRDTKALVA